MEDQKPQTWLRKWSWGKFSGKLSKEESITVPVCLTSITSTLKACQIKRENHSRTKKEDPCACAESHVEPIPGNQALVWFSNPAPGSFSCMGRGHWRWICRTAVAHTDVPGDDFKDPGWRLHHQNERLLHPHDSSYHQCSLKVLPAAWVHSSWPPWPHTASVPLPGRKMMLPFPHVCLTVNQKHGIYLFSVIENAPSRFNSG